MNKSIPDFTKDFTQPRNVYAFYRLKPDCISRFAVTRQHNLISITADGLCLVCVSEELFKINRDWLLRRPYLSCMTEIQRIKLKE